MASITLSLRRSRNDEERIALLAERQRRREEERQARELRAMEREMARHLRSELRRVARLLNDRLTQLEFAYFSKADGKLRVSRLRFAEAVATPAALYYRVDTARMPRGVRTAALEDPEVLEDLALAVRAPVTTFRHYEHGFWLVVERSAELVAIPRFVEFDEVFFQLPKSGKLVFGLGIGKNRRVYHTDLDALPHLLVAGATGYGKSVFLHNLVCTLALRPPLPKLLFIDLKGGVEFAVYRDLPGVEIVKSRPEALDLLEAVYREVERRLQIFEEAKVRDVAAYNSKREGKLQRWVVICDEVANLMLDRKTREHAERLLADIAARGRAPGVHLVIATQRPSVDVVTGLIKANFPARVAFNCADQASSRVILDRSDAAGLGRPGLLIFSWETQLITCQAPFVSEEKIRSVVENVAAGRAVEAPGPVSAEEILRWALENGGYLQVNNVFQAFRGRGITHAWVRNWLAQISGKVVEVDGRKYRICGGRGREGRRLQEVKE